MADNVEDVFAKGYHVFDPSSGTSKGKPAGSLAELIWGLISSRVWGALHARLSTQICFAVMTGALWASESCCSECCRVTTVNAGSGTPAELC
jgi:hypothetical protein